MSKPKDILLFVPDGVGIRNYLYSDVFKNRPDSLHLYHNFDADTLDRLKTELNLSTTLAIPLYRESMKEKFYRELIHLCRLKLNARQSQNPTIMHLWQKPRKGIKQKLFYGFIDAVGVFYSGYSSILRLEKRYQRLIRKNPTYKKVKAQLSELRVDKLFCTHQRALKAPVIFAAATDLGIATATVIYSWDNIPKARLALQADSYLVWSDYMKGQLKQFYPEISDDQITVSGTPQFESYLMPENIIPREEFFARYHLDAKKKTICFSGDDEYTSPHDPKYLADLAYQLRHAGLDKHYQILLRRCPVDVSGRFDSVVKQYSDIIKTAPPLWNFNSAIWSAVYPTQEDVKLLVSVAYHCDVVVNLGSTMAFDFGMFDKPCIYISYDQQKGTGWSVDTIYKFEHFRSMPTKTAVLWWNAPEQLPELLKQITKDKTDIKSWMQVVIDQVEASDKIYNQLTRG